MWQCNCELIQHWHKKILIPRSCFVSFNALIVSWIWDKVAESWDSPTSVLYERYRHLKEVGIPFITFVSIVPSPNSCSSKTIYAQNQPKWKLRKKPLFSCRSSFTSLMIGKVDLRWHCQLYNMNICTTNSPKRLIISLWMKCTQTETPKLFSSSSSITWCLNRSQVTPPVLGITLFIWIFLVGNRVILFSQRNWKLRFRKSSSFT